MDNDYTKGIYEKITIFACDEYLDEGIKFLKEPNFFRTFDKGLIELIKKIDHSGKLDNIFDMTDFLYLKLQKINSSIEKNTIYSWFSGKHSPKIEAGSRQKIYEICFSLNLSYDNTLWFFHHVYYDRAFNCHNITEAVYYYAFLNNLQYQEALNIIKDVQLAPTPSAIENTQANYTQFVRDRITNFKTVDDLKEFLISNKENFNTWNKSALNKLRELVDTLIAQPESAAEIAKFKRVLTRKINSISVNTYNYEEKNHTINGTSNDDSNSVTGANSNNAENSYNVENSYNAGNSVTDANSVTSINLDTNKVADTVGTANTKHNLDCKYTCFTHYDKCNKFFQCNKLGLIIKEIFFNANALPNANNSSYEYIWEYIYKKNIRKNSFILDYIIGSSSGMNKKQNIPYVIRNNFPSKKTMSDLLSEEKISISKSYDSIRKLIVLLDFYCFWVNVKLHKSNPELTKEDLTAAYIDEANDCLYNCGYEELYAGNPYDWIFLCSAHSTNPLDHFRSLVGDMILEE